VGRTRPDAKSTAPDRTTTTTAAKPPKGAVAPAAGTRSSAALAPTATDPLITSEFTERFEQQELAAHWRVTSDAWRIAAGRLCVSGAHNHPIWLAKRLPTNARIEFEAVSYSPDGDLKAEFWGDGRSAASQASYTNATSYLTIFGGWKNRFHVLARIDEHAAGRPERVVDTQSADIARQPVSPDRTYHFRVERADGKTVIWWVDDVEILRYADDAPLLGSGHEHFGFNNWEVRVCFDNLRVVPLGG
jgi:hypothetical protein